MDANIGAGEACSPTKSLLAKSFLSLWHSVKEGDY